MKTIEAQSKLQLIASLCIFGTISLFVRNIALGSGMIALSRGVLGAVFLLLYLALRKQKLDLPAIRKNLWILLLSGGIMGLNWALLFEAYRYTTVATATLCYYMQPVFLTLAAAVLLGEKLSLKKGLCVLVALCGMVLISGALGGALPEAGELRGIALGLGAAILYACVILCNKKLRDIGAVEAEPVVCDGAARRVVDVLQETILEVNVHQVEHCAAPRAHKVRVRFRVAVEALEAADRSDRDDQTFVLEHGQVPVDRAEA